LSILQGRRVDNEESNTGLVEVVGERMSEGVARARGRHGASTSSSISTKTSPGEVRRYSRQLIVQLADPAAISRVLRHDRPSVVAAVRANRRPRGCQITLSGTGSSVKSRTDGVVRSASPAHDRRNLATSSDHGEDHVSSSGARFRGSARCRRPVEPTGHAELTIGTHQVARPCRKARRAGAQWFLVARYVSQGVMES
jgi:hypothetical protein